MPRPSVGRSSMPDDEEEVGTVVAPETALTTEARRVAEEESSGTAPAGRNLLRDFLRPSRGQLTVALILLLTALLLVWTLRSQAAQPSYTNLRRTELIQLLDNVSSETRRLESDIRDLQSTRDELASGAKGAEAAREEANRRLDDLQIIAGTVPAHGSGVRITISDPEKKMSPELLLDALEELRDAGAEVMEINDHIRVTTSTWLGRDGQGRIVADDQVVSAPVVLDVIGDPPTLEAGARFRGGLVSEVEGARVGGSVNIEQLDRIDIDSVVIVQENEFARPS